MSSKNVRPTGVVILAILEILSGITAIGGGFMFATFTAMAGLGDFGVFGGVLSGILIAIGIASFVMAWGLLNGKPWAWTVTLILTIIAIIFDLPSFNIIGLIIEAIILYYLFRPHVKAYFGKEQKVL